MILLINNAKPNLADLHYIKYIRNVLRKNNIDFIETRKIEDLSLKISTKSINGIIISGSPLQLSKPLLLEEYGYILHYLLEYPNCPVLGICFGCQLLAMLYSGFTLEHQSKYLCTEQPVLLDNTHPLFLLDEKEKEKTTNTKEIQFCFSDLIIPNKKIKKTREIAWFKYNNKRMPCAFEFSNHKYGTLFHPEYFEDTHYILLNFCRMII
jgi:GMP synthase-like glutamine amidotransferase